MASAIYEGSVFHKRFKPKIHQLKYRVCSFLFDLDELDQLDRDLKLFSRNRWNIVSFWDKDHGAGTNQTLRPYVEKVLDEAGLQFPKGRIELLCYPRLFGYVFNPLSIYYCHDDRGQIRAVIYEVSNTFSQRHSYVIEVDEGQNGPVSQRCQKGFYVSPFIEMDCEYNFNLSLPSDHISVLIHQNDHDGKLLTACFRGMRKPLTDKGLAGMIVRFPLMTLKVVAGIHWEAFHLWRKGIKLVKRPLPPASPVTVITSRQVETKV